jgi:hypothetical protein
MEVRETVTVWIDREPTLDEEIGALTDEDVFDMANLTEAQTGITGVITITTVMGQHGPRVKYFIRRGQPSFSVAIASEPRVVANSMDDRDLSRMAPRVIEWVRLNHERLNAFWWDGAHWMQPDVQSFIDDLRKA